MNDNDTQQSSENRDNDRTPGAAGHPEPGSGHDDSKTTTVKDGPPLNQAARNTESTNQNEEQ
jgi:hypothetical protein